MKQNMTRDIPTLRAILKSFTMILLTCVLAFYLILLITDAQFEHLNKSVRDQTSKRREFRTISLIDRFRAFQSKEHLTEENRLRREVRTILNLKVNTEQAGLSTPKHRIGNFLLHWINLILSGKDEGSTIFSNKEIQIDTAFVFELDRNYSEAINRYNMAIDGDTSADAEYYFSLVHKGYCAAQLNYTEEAKAIFSRVSSSKAPELYRRVSQLLLDILNERLETVKHTKKSSLPESDGEELYNHASYVPAIILMEGYPDHLRTSKGRYILGRAYEEIGNAQQALHHYEKLINGDFSSPWALRANRRIYVMESVYRENPAVAARAAKRAKERFGDNKVFIEIDGYIDAQKKVRASENGFNSIRDVHYNGNPMALRPERIAIDRIIERVSARQITPGSGIVMNRRKIISDEESIRRPTNRQALITTNDGNIFIGTPLRETESTLYMKTTMGNIEIRKEAIKERQVVVER